MRYIPSSRYTIKDLYREKYLVGHPDKYGGWDYCSLTDYPEVIFTSLKSANEYYQSFSKEHRKFFEIVLL